MDRPPMGFWIGKRTSSSSGIHPFGSRCFLLAGSFLYLHHSIAPRGCQGVFEKIFYKISPFFFRYVARSLCAIHKRISILTDFLLLPPHPANPSPTVHFARRRAPERPSGRRLKTPTILRNPKALARLYCFASLFLLESD